VLPDRVHQFGKMFVRAVEKIDLDDIDVRQKLAVVWLILQTASGQSGQRSILQTAPAQFG